MIYDNKSGHKFSILNKGGLMLEKLVGMNPIEKVCWNYIHKFIYTGKPLKSEIIEAEACLDWPKNILKRQGD